MGVTVTGLVIWGVAQRATRGEGGVEAIRIRNNAPGVYLFGVMCSVGDLTPPAHPAVPRWSAD